MQGTGTFQVLKATLVLGDDAASLTNEQPINELAGDHPEERKLVAEL